MKRTGGSFLDGLAGTDSVVADVAAVATAAATEVVHQATTVDAMVFTVQRTGVVMTLCNRTIMTIKHHHDSCFSWSPFSYRCFFCMCY